MEGTKFGRYQLEELLGEGGMGQVYRAYDTQTDRDVALKVLRAATAADKVFQERFRREARTVASLRSPHIVPIYDFGEINGRMFICMQLLEGQGLDAILTNTGPLAPDRAVAVIDQAASALDSAHSAGVVHRDVKPSNLLITPGNFVYLIDFGIARAAGETSLTTTGATIGTFAYISPERFTTGTADSGSDIYALTCVLYQLLTDRTPFPVISLEQQIAAHLTAPPPKPSAWQPDIGATFDEVIARGMAKDPEARYRTATELATAAIEALALQARPDVAKVRPANETSSGSPSSPPPRTSEPSRDPDTAFGTRHDHATQSNPAEPDGSASTSAGSARLSQGNHRSNPATDSAIHSGKGQEQITDRSPRSTGHRPRPKRSGLVLLACGVGLALVISGVVWLTQSSGTTAQHEASPPSTSQPASSFGAQQSMRFDFADAEVTGFAVDSTGNIFASGNGGRIQKIAAGSTSPTEFSTVGSTGYMNLAVGTDGDIFATNWKSNKVVRLDPSGRTVGEFDYPGGSTHAGVTVDPSGDVYVFEYMPVDGSNSMTPHLWEFAAGSTLPTEIPVKLDVSVSEYIAAGTSGNIYALPDNVISQGVIKLTGEGSPVSLTEPPNAGFDLKGMAVDRNGELYICNSVTGAVYRVNPWIGSQVRLPLSGLKDPIGVGVDGSGSVYVVQSDATVWKLPALK